eukprot:evm.model.NODE_4642_length_71726_cov_21.816496.3
MTRKAPEFDVVLPPGQEIGLWLETDWNHHNLIVKGLKANRWAEKTEIQKGDVLLTIEGQAVAGKNFKKVMAALKELLATTGATLRFRTHEEDMRLLRMRALGQLVVDTQHHVETGNGDKEGPEYIAVQLKPVGPSVYIIVNRLDPSTNPPYRIVNRTKNFMIHFRQLGCLVSNLQDWTKSKVMELEVQQQQMEKNKLQQEGAAEHHLQLEHDGPINHRKLANVR